MELLSGVTLVNSSRRQTVANNYLQGKKYVAFYFSAHWCPPCRQFTPQLARAYSGAPARKGEVIFVSSDRSEEDMFSYMQESHGGWLAIDYKNSSLRSLLGSRLQVHGIPALVIVNLLDGSVLAQDGRAEISSYGPGAFATWDSLVSEIDTSVVDLIRKNDSTLMSSACDVLNRLLSNVIKDPHNMKYRSIKLENPKIAASLLNAEGAFEILFSVGFEESDGCLILPLNASIPLITAFRDKVKLILEGEKEEPEIIPTPIMTPASSANMQTSSVGQRVEPFKSKILQEVELCRTYEDSVNQTLALSCVPLEKFDEKSRKVLNSSSSSSEKPPEQGLLKDLTLMEIVLWFKSDFFKWFDAPVCSCEGGCPMEAMASGLPTPLESRDGAGAVERYKCPKCNSETRFPRYHAKPTKLLETREGRCGEWANCFALIARSCGYEVRRVLDWTDHVWVEVYSEHQGRWIHVDPCEGIIDKPLLYESGWNKELSYVIASSIHEVMDVTPRYVKDMKVTKKRKRNLVSEKWLSDTIGDITEDLMGQLPKEVKEQAIQRRVKELVELMKERSPDVSNASLPGRQSGSSAWRLQRGEMGKLHKSNVWTPNQKECQSKVFELSYDIVCDEYIRGKDERISGWLNGLSDMKDIFRKEESDWKMVYLARQESCSSGKLTWEFDLSETSLSIKSIELRVESKTYENGRVLWQLCGNNLCLIPSPATTLNSEALSGAKKVTLTASLSGGSGPHAWQHAQVFRFPIKEESPGTGLAIKIIMQEDSSSS
eukprot:TRINITY_DN166_c1_g1_i1.p1 TRINITY_DN166_c1_g1~~TRINITY_DN166_c1_g1_i1.p1  ORF type:complete len:772 (+),score=180.55 TRINITY_DN166_c1_g1_i1:355-2670(+)